MAPGRRGRRAVFLAVAATILAIAVTLRPKMVASRVLVRAQDPATRNIVQVCIDGLLPVSLTQLCDAIQIHSQSRACEKEDVIPVVLDSLPLRDASLTVLSLVAHASIGTSCAYFVYIAICSVAPTHS